MLNPKSYRRSLILKISLAFIAIPVLVLATGLPPDEQAFVDKHISDVVKVDSTKLDDASLTKVFAVPFYKVKVTIVQGDGEEDNDVIVARINDKLVSVGRPSSDADLPEFVKMFKPDFKLKADGDAKLLQQALDAAYPAVIDSDKQVEAFSHNGTEWTFIRGNFINNKLGYIIDTDADGTIKTIKFKLGI